MWARITEVFLAAWLLASPFVFGHAQEPTGLWLVDIGTGVALIGLATHSFYRPLQRYHLLVPVVGLWLIVSAFLSGPHPLPLARQNHIMVGLFLLMLGIVPNQAARPPQKWRELNRGMSKERVGATSQGRHAAPEPERVRTRSASG